MTGPTRNRPPAHTGPKRHHFLNIAGFRAQVLAHRGPRLAQRTTKSEFFLKKIKKIVVGIFFTFFFGIFLLKISKKIPKISDFRFQISVLFLFFYFLYFFWEMTVKKIKNYKK